ncbi:MAG: 23S rRNA (guanosine(2251)-2'-O)-methyltransferase RlmB [Methyloligellaceae bacterium]
MIDKGFKTRRKRVRRESPAGEAPAPGTCRLFGLHAVEAALRNPARPVTRLCVTDNAARRLAAAIAGRHVAADRVRPQDLDQMLGSGAVHQGVLLETNPLPAPELETFAEAGLVVVLDKITDPQNVGAILRSAAAFAADALVVTARHSPPFSGVTAKAASGALEHVPVVTVTNLARALATLGDMGFARIGLDGGASATLETEPLALPLALILGAEDKGMRRLTREACDRTCRLTTSGPVASLNVSNAAAVALHTIRLRTGA